VELLLVRNTQIFLFFIILLNNAVCFSDSVDVPFYKSISLKQSLSINSLNTQFTFTNFKSDKNLQLLANSTPLIKYYADLLVKENIPIEFAILPLIESSNNPQAKSKQNALGLWQFIPETAKEYNLRKIQTDDRTDVEKSTRAAINLLKKLYLQFNDWNLVLASYNWGSGRVENSLKKGLITRDGKVNLDLLPDETKNYLISFYTYNYIIKSQFESIILKKFPNKPFIIKIDRSNLYKYLNEHPNLQNVSSSVLMHINGYDVFKYKKNEVLVPTEIFPHFFSISQVSFKNINLKKNTNTACNEKNADTYFVRYGDTFQNIASKNSLRIDKLIELNPSIRFLRPGMQLSICYN